MSLLPMGPQPISLPRSILSLAVLMLASASPDRADTWPSFRGAFAHGVADGQNLPVSWDVESRENVRWRAAIPGTGHSSPVVWHERIFVTAAVTDAGASLVLGDNGGIDQAADTERTFSWYLHCLDADDRWHDGGGDLQLRGHGGVRLRGQCALARRTSSSV